MATRNSSDWQNKLPMIDPARRDSLNPRINACYSHKDSKTFFYPVQAEYIGQGYVYWGFAVLPNRRFPIAMEISAYELESGKWMGNVPCLLDSGFVAGCWKDVKSEHYESPDRRSGRKLREKPHKGA